MLLQFVFGPLAALSQAPHCFKCLQTCSSGSLIGLSSFSPPDTVVVSHPPGRQVIRGCAVGDKHAGRAAVPGSVQRAGPQVCHGRELPGPAGQLRGQTVSTGHGGQRYIETEKTGAV